MSGKVVFLDQMGLSSHCALVHLYPVGFDYYAVNGQDFSCLNDRNVSDNQVIRTYNLPLAISHHCNIFLRHLLVKFLELLLFDIVIERADANHYYYSNNNGKTFNPSLA